MSLVVAYKAGIIPGKQGEIALWRIVIVAMISRLSSISSDCMTPEVAALGVDIGDRQERKAKE